MGDRPFAKAEADSVYNQKHEGGINASPTPDKAVTRSIQPENLIRFGFVVFSN